MIISPQDKTEIVVVLDRSGSMGSIKDSTIAGFNEFLAEQQKQQLPASFTLAQFDDEYQIDYDGVDLFTVKPLTTETFVPRNSTALFDAIGRTIHSTEARLSKNQEKPKVVFVIITDGLENASKEYVNKVEKAADGSDSKVINRGIDQINKLISAKRQENWQFLFLGANQDAITTAAQMNIGAANAMNYAAGAVGTSNMYKGMSKKMSNFRASGLAEDLAFNDEDRAESMKPDSPTT